MSIHLGLEQMFFELTKKLVFLTEHLARQHRHDGDLQSGLGRVTSEFAFMSYNY